MQESYNLFSHLLKPKFRSKWNLLTTME